MSTRTSRGAAAAALVTVMGLGVTALPAEASAAAAGGASTGAPAAARAKAASKLKVVAKTYDAVGSQGVGFTEYDVTFLLKRHGRPYAGKVICLYVKVPRHGLLRGECRRTDANGQAVLGMGTNRKATYYVTFKGDRRTKATTKVVVIRGHKV